MYTYIVYNTILFLSTLFAFLAQRSYNSNYKGAYTFFLFSSFLALFIPAAIRYDIGVDYKHYADYFELIKSGYFVAKEPLYILLNKAIALLGLDVQWFFVITSFIIYYFLYKIIPIKHLALGVFLYVVTLYLVDYSAIRQAIAVVLSTYAIQLLSEKRIKKFFIYIALAILIHLSTGLGILLVSPFIRRNYNKYLLLILLLLFYIVVVYGKITQVILFNIGDLIPKYAWYATSNLNMSAKVTSGLGILIRLFIAVVIIFFKDSIVKKNRHANVVVNLYVLYVLAYILNLDVHIFERVRHIYQFFSILSILYFIDIFDKKSKIVAASCIAFIFYAFFLKDINTDKKGVGAGLEINPYETILDR